MNTINIYSLKLCGYLCVSGFPVKGVRPNSKCQNKSVYIFEDTPKLRECLSYYDKTKDYSLKENKKDESNITANCCNKTLWEKL